MEKKRKENNIDQLGDRENETAETLSRRREWHKGSVMNREKTAPVKELVAPFVKPSLELYP